MSEATKAARVYKETQPTLDMVKETVAANEAAKKTLGAYMMEHELTIFRGVSLRIVNADAWDNLALLAYLGDKAKDYRKATKRKYFDIVKRARKKPAAQAPTAGDVDCAS